MIGLDLPGFQLAVFQNGTPFSIVWDAKLYLKPPKTGSETGPSQNGTPFSIVWDTLLFLKPPKTGSRNGIQKCEHTTDILRTLISGAPLHNRPFGQWKYVGDEYFVSHSNDCCTVLSSMIYVYVITWGVRTYDAVPNPIRWVIPLILSWKQQL